MVWPPRRRLKRNLGPPYLGARANSGIRRGGITGIGTHATAAGRRPPTSSTDLPTSTLHRESSYLHRESVIPADPAIPADLGARDPEVRAGRDPVAPANPADRVALANRAGLVDRADPEDGAALGITNRAGLGVTNRAALGVMADTGPADRAAPANRVDRVDLADRGSPVHPVDTNRAVRGPRDRVRVARDLGQNRAHLGRTAPSRAHRRRAVLSRAHLHRMRADLRRMRADPHRIQDHLPAPTHPAVATHLPVRTRLAEAIHPVAATPVAAAHPGEAIADTEGTKPLDCEFVSQSSGFGRCVRLCI